MVVFFFFNRDRKVAANEAAAKKLGEDIRTRNLGKELIGSRIKIECWDSMEVQKKEVSHAAAGSTSPIAAYYICASNVSGLAAFTRTSVMSMEFIHPAIHPLGTCGR